MQRGGHGVPARPGRGLLHSGARRLLDQPSDLPRVRDEGYVTRLDLGGRRTLPLGVEPLELGIDGPVLLRDQVPGRDGLPRRLLHGRAEGAVAQNDRRLGGVPGDATSSSRRPTRSRGGRGRRLGTEGAGTGEPRGDEAGQPEPGDAGADHGTVLPVRVEQRDGADQGNHSGCGGGRSTAAAARRRLDPGAPCACGPVRLSRVPPAT
jgi:hypothetical protein